MEAIKTALKWIVLPFTLLLSAIFFLINQTRAMKGELASAKAEREMGELLSEIARAKEEAARAEKEFYDASRGILPDDDGPGAA